MSGGLCYCNYRPFSDKEGVWLLLLTCFIEISVSNAKSVDPDPTSPFAASDLGLHCLFACVPFKER